MAIILDDEELIHLTNRKRLYSQKTALTFMGIEYKVRPDGSIAVSRSHVEQVLGGSMKQSKQKEVEPDWSSI